MKVYLWYNYQWELLSIYTKWLLVAREEPRIGAVFEYYASLSLSIYLEVPESTSRNHVLASGDKPCTNKTRKNLNRPSSYIILNSKTTISSFTRRPPCHYTVHPTLSQDLAWRVAWGSLHSTIRRINNYWQPPGHTSSLTQGLKVQQWLTITLQSA